MGKMDIPKAYEPQVVEDGVYAAWEKSGFFRPENLPNLRSRTDAFTIVLPPPNVTGTLHMGHAAMLAIEDIMIRFARMRGKRALWIPGTDHAAIATQTKVEKLLMSEGIKDPRGELGREKFLERIRQFATESHNVIVNQCKKMGASLDWSREAYTLDDARNRAVNAVFQMMYDDGLIYRGYRVVNWCQRCQSTLADDEVEYKEEKTKFYYFKYGPVVIGTARPETKFADKVIIVHPDDVRYKTWVGKSMEVEWIEGPVKATMVADPSADMALGSGAMTITPAHSFVDFELAQKYGFEVLPIIDEDGNFTAAAGSFAGKNAARARDEIVEVLRRKGLVDRIDENYVHNLSVCYRCGTSIEPLPKLQWFIDVNKPFAFRASKHSPLGGIQDGQEVTLKFLMQHVVRTNQVEIIPDRFNATYFHWIDNLRDWNISRQIWFGHRVPVWYLGGAKASPVGQARPRGTKDVEMFVGIEPPEGDGWEQDSDTLDTWFSSGLWTFSTLGWPNQTEDLKIYHPTSVLETGYDILFFWVARMILMTTYALGEVPFNTVYLHGLVRDEQGRKMSKSLDNIIDPLGMISKYGADATRLSLVIGTTPGNDMKLSEEKVAGYRNFANKLWNIARFVLTSVRVPPLPEGGLGGVGDSPPEGKTLGDRWILGRLAEVAQAVTVHLEKYELSAAGELLRDFTWGEFADWYVEMAKGQRGQGTEGKESTDRILLFVLERLLALWHPFMPFVTEEIWKRFGQGDMMMVRAWPTLEGGLEVETRASFERVRDTVTAIRNLRAQYKVAPSREVPAMLVSQTHGYLFQEQTDVIKRLARVSDLTISSVLAKPEGVVSAIVGDVQIYLPLADLVDVGKERARLRQELVGVEQYLTGLAGKLGNTELISKAPKHVIEGMKEKQAEAQKKAKALKQRLSSL